MAKADSELAALRETYDEILRCGRCGFCQTTCPVYRVTGREGSVARGHHAHARALVEGDVSLGEDLQSAIFECLLCKSCVANCFGAVKTHEVMLAARHEYIRRYGLPFPLSFVFRILLQNPKLMTHLLRMAFVGKRTGLADLVEHLRVLRWVSKEAAAANKLMDADEVPSTFFVDRLKDIDLKPENPRLTVAYFVGCGYNYALPDVSETSVKMLVEEGCEVRVINNNCCGLPPYVYGDFDAARSLAKKNLEMFNNLNVDTIITECGSCYSFLKTYPELIHTDEAKTFANKVNEFSDFMGKRMPPRQRDAVKVTYHDPCHLSRYEEVREQPRELLRRTNGVDYIELPEADWCCGGAGTYNIFHYDQSMEILKRKMENIRSTAADIVATSCPACMIQLRHGAKLFDVPVEVLHVSQVVRPTPASVNEIGAKEVAACKSDVEQP